MGLEDPKDVIPGIIVVICAVGFIGGLTVYFHSIADVPVLGMVSSFVHTLFLMLAGFITPYIAIEAGIIAMLLEVLIAVLCVVFIIKTGF